MSVGEMLERKERPAYVRFERRPIEDKAESIKQGRFVARDVDFALITPPYSKDCVEHEISRWIENMEKNVRDGRIPEDWAKQWKESYKAWKNGQEMPLHGTPIKGWGLISPAQQEMLIRMNVLTVEDLALMNDEGIRHTGMGAIELRDKAKNWLKSLDGSGKLAMEMTAVQRENTTLKESVETMQAQIAFLLKNQGKAIMPPVETINIDEILSESEEAETTEPVRRKPGRPPAVKE